ncbi:MAG: hypothetical protein ACHP9V_00450 [Terriglobales bacterium]
MVKMRFTVFLTMALSLLLLGTMMAQGPGGEGEFLILSAQYGTEHHHVDVTGRLKELAAHDRTFRVTHDSMRADPAEGRPKALRIYARGPNGGERMFEYVDGSVVDGGMFRAWGRGEWGNGGWSGNWNGGGAAGEGEYVILSAQYGTERNHVDVTQRLREEARRDRVFQNSNGVFGVDPDPGVVKTLRIYARGPNGQERMFEYREGTMVEGAQFRGWGSGEWGTGGWSGNWKGGAVGGAVDEGEYVILSAQYGTGRNHVDVTERLKELARADRRFIMGNNSFGVDPDRGVVKTLRIYARGPNGREQMFEYREGSVVDGAQFRGWGRGEFGNGNDRWSGKWEGERREEMERERQR